MALPPGGTDTAKVAGWKPCNSATTVIAPAGTASKRKLPSALLTACATVRPAPSTRRTVAMGRANRPGSVTRPATDPVPVVIVPACACGASSALEGSGTTGREV